nr:hypothetical protein [Tanacetum cinerariifolium]
MEESKNDTTVAHVDVLKNETTDADVDALKNDTTVVDIEIDSEILSPFEPMDVDLVVNSTVSTVAEEFKKRKEYHKSYYQWRKEKNTVDANANMEAQTPVGATQYLSCLTRETALGTDVTEDPKIQKTREYNRSYYQRRKEKKIADSNANMESQTPVGSTQYLSDLPHETNIDEQTINSVLLPLFDQEFNQTMTGTDVTEDPNIQKTREHNKSYYQCRKEQNKSQDDRYDFVYNRLSKAHHILKEEPPCVIFEAKKIQYEFPTFCCMKGKTTLQPLGIPTELYNLFTLQCQLGKMFRKNICAYNTNFSFGSMGVKLDKRYSARGSGVYTFSVQRGINHRNDQLVPRDGEPRPEYPTQIQPYVDSYNPLPYPMFFPNGEAGWHSRLPRKGVDKRELADDDDDLVEDDEGTKVFII